MYPISFLFFFLSYTPITVTSFTTILQNTSIYLTIIINNNANYEINPIASLLINITI